MIVEDLIAQLEKCPMGAIVFDQYNNEIFTVIEDTLYGRNDRNYPVVYIEGAK